MFAPIIENLFVGLSAYLLGLNTPAIVAHSVAASLLDINAKNIDADVISVSADDLVSADVVSVTADSLTTGDVFNATADSLTTGSLIHMTHTGSDKSEVSLVHFESTGDRGDDSNQTVLLDLNFDTTDGTGARALRIDSEQTTGKVFELDATELTTGEGIRVDLASRTTGYGVNAVSYTHLTLPTILRV